MARPIKGQEFDLLKAVNLRRQKHLSYKDIGKLMGVCPQSVEERMARMGEAFNDMQRVETFKAYEPELIDAIRSGITERIADTVLAKDSKGNWENKIGLSQLVVSYGILVDKARLIRGESTSGVQQITSLIIAAHKVKVVESKEKGYSNNSMGKVIDVTPESVTPEQALPESISTDPDFG